MKEKIAAAIEQALNGSMTQQEIENALETPKHAHLGDMAFPCFHLAKQSRKSPNIIAAELALAIQCEWIEDAQAAGGYCNIFYTKQKVKQQVCEMILHDPSKYGQKPITNQNVVIDFSSPNIAKPFSMGHLRSTVIGNALANIAEKNGYHAVRINHLGDWGTQFGKLIVAYRIWGDASKIEAAPIQELLKLYVRFHDEAKTNEKLNDEARAAFKALEDQDEASIALWNWFKDASLEEFKMIYDMMHISFDSYDGEAFYNDKMQVVIEELKDKNLLTLSDGAYVVPLEEMPPCLITKQDGATLYATRDLAAALYRQQHFNPAKVFYVVGNEQSLHFKQLFTVLQKMGHTWVDNYEHVPFGMMLKDGKKMSTRKGRIVLLKEVLDEAITAAQKNIEEKNPTLANKEIVAKQVGIGAVIFNDLKNERLNDIEFSLEQMLSFEGETGPYVQYTYARICSILEKAVIEPPNETKQSVENDYEWAVLLTLQHFPQAISDAFEQASPAVIAKYASQLARQFNKYYATTKILSEDEYKNDRIALCVAVAAILKESLSLLGMEAPENM